MGGMLPLITWGVLYTLFESWQAFFVLQLDSAVLMFTSIQPPPHLREDGLSACNGICNSTYSTGTPFTVRYTCFSFYFNS